MVVARISSDVSYSFDDITILPGAQKAGIKPEDVDLGVYITEDMYMPVGWLAAAMQCVSNDELGIAAAQHGCCVVLPRSLSIEDQVKLGQNIKRAKAGFNYHVITIGPYDPISKIIELQEKEGYSTFPVVDENKKLVGLLTEKQYHPKADLGREVRERMIKVGEGLITAQDGIDLKEANERLFSNKIGTLPIVDSEGKYIASVFWSDLKKHTDFPNAFLDEEGQYRYAAAISTFEPDMERAEAMVEDGKCDILNVDTAHCKGEYGDRQIRRVKKKYLYTPVVAGNIIDEEGFNLIADAGAEVAKGGIGPGHGCTTRGVKGTGIGQVTATQKLCAARDHYARRTWRNWGRKGRRILVCTDGGMKNTGDMNKAYACRADMLMHGNYFGQWTESAAPIRRIMVEIEPGGKRLTTPVSLKEYWGEASPRAHNIERYGYDSPLRFVPEGAEGFIPHRGSIHDKEDGIELDIAFVRKTIAESGALNPQEFAERVELMIQSSGSREEGRSKV